MREIGAGNVVGDQGKAVAAGSAGRVFDVETADQGGGRCGVRGSGFGSAGDIDRLFVGGQA